MKKAISLLTLALVIIVFTSAPARADRKTMEGFLLGTGAVLLGTAIIHEMHRDTPPRYQHSKPPRREYRRADYRHKNKYRTKKHHRRGPKGHWEVNRIWIDPIYERKWNPGHYSRHGDWVKGRHKRFMIADGYWKEKRSWVRH